MLKSISGSKISKIFSIAVAMTTASVHRQLIGLLVDEAERLLVAHLHVEPEPDQHQNPGRIVPEERRRAGQNRNQNQSRRLDHKHLAPVRVTWPQEGAGLTLGPERRSCSPDPRLPSAAEAPPPAGTHRDVTMTSL